jgi:hypothetical protein
MKRRALFALACVGALLWPAAQAAHPPRFIALVADQLTKSGEASGDTASAEPEATWRGLAGATVISGLALTRSAAERVLSDRTLRGRQVVVQLRGVTTVGPSGPPAWLVHSSLSGHDALLDPARLITATDIRGWLARSGAARTVLFIDGSEGVDALCMSLSRPAAARQKPLLTAWCQRSGGAATAELGAWLAGMPGDPTRVAQVFSDTFRGVPEVQAGKSLAGIDLASSSYYLLKRGNTCRPLAPGAADVPSWVDRIEWPASGPAVRWGSRCNDNGMEIARNDPELRMSSDGALLLYRGQRYLRLTQAPPGDGFEAKAPEQRP